MIGYLENRLSFLDKLYSPSNKEVYTPLALVNEMLDKLPEEVWDDTTLKWLNPAVKNGVFLGSIIFRLLNNYIEKGIFNIEQEAYNHIIQHQIYGYALSKGALRTANKLIYGSAKYNGNIVYANPLEEQIDMKFDVIIGNPPYQDNTSKVKSNSSGNNSLWIRFIIKCYETIKHGGYFSFIIPSGWINGEPDSKQNGRKTVNSIRTFLSKNQLLNVTLNTPNNYFNVGQDISYFILKKDVPRNTTTFDYGTFTYREIDSKLKWIPRNIKNKIVFSILKKTGWSERYLTVNTPTGWSCDYSRNPKCSKEKINSHIYKLYNTSSQYMKNTFIWGDEPGPFHYEKKVVFSLSGYASPVYSDGDGGLALNSRCILVENRDEANRLINYLNSKLIKFIYSTKISGPTSKLELIRNNIPKIDLNMEMTDENIYNYFNLTQEEIDYIEANV